MSNNEHPKKFVEVLGKRIAYVEMGEGDPIIFQHGNPTSSYLWRNIMPPIANLGRCIALDLVGMGDSDKLDHSGPDSYTFVEHRKYLDGALEGLGIADNVTWIIHDWGSALGFDWCNRHRNSVRGIAYMEAIVRPVTWEEWPADARPVFQAMRSPAGDEMVLEKNTFIERILPGSTLNGIEEEAMEVYRRPYLEPGESRRPTLTWPRQIPIEGEPADVVEIVHAYSQWMAENDIPKLFVNAEPGAITTGKPREFCRTWKNQQEVTVAGSHFIQEDSPDEIAEAIRKWLVSI